MNVRLLTAVAVVSSALLMSCGGSASPSPAPSSSPSASQTPRTSPAPSGPTGKIAKLKDPKSDLKDPDGGTAKRRSDIDIVAVSGQVVKGQLVVNVQVAATIAATYPSAKADVSYLVAIEADGSGDSDYWLTLTNREDGSWVPELTDWATSETYPDKEFPGAGAPSKSTVSFRVDLESLGSPGELRLSVITQVADHETGNVVAEDQSPAGQQYIPDKKWLTVPVPQG